MKRLSLYDEVSDVKTFYRRIYFDAIDTVTNCIKTWFSQPGYRAVKNTEQLILNVINGLEYQNQLEDVCSDYGEEVNHYRLSTQLQILKTKFVDSNEKNVSAIINFMKNNIGVQSLYLGIILLKLYLVLPATNAISERSASSMLRIKNWLRSAMSQKRLNHRMLLSIHKKNVANVFCEANEERRRTFGIFCHKDLLQLNVWSVDIFEKITC